MTVVVRPAPSAPLLAGDPTLPGRDALLDADSVAEVLAGSLGTDGPLEIEACTLDRVKYRLGESIRVTYRVIVDGLAHRVSARGFPAATGSAARGFERALGDATPVGGLRPVVLDAARDAVWWTFPNDRCLRAADLVPPSPCVAALAGPDAVWSASEVFELAPERSVTVRATDPRGRAVGFAKLYAPGGPAVRDLAARYAAIAAGLRRGGRPVASPRVLGHAPERRLLVLEPMPGERWGQVNPTAMPEVLGRLGVAIAAVHELAPPPGVRPFARLAPDRLARSCTLIGRARPEVSRRASALGARLADRRPDEDDPVLLHGDCHPKNALVSTDSISVIDLDQSGVGPAAADIGSLLARLHHGALLGERGTDATARLSAAFLDGYAAVRPLPSEASLRWYTSAALIGERAIRAVNRVHRPALARMDELLAGADEILRHEPWL